MYSRSLQQPPVDGLASADGLDRFQRGEGEDNEWAWHLLLTKEARESLPEQEVLRQSAMFELINGERSYVKDLQLVKDVCTLPATFWDRQSNHILYRSLYVVCVKHVNLF